MFSAKIGQPTKVKKTIYLILFVILGLLLSFNLHALVEVNYLNWSLASSREVRFYGGCSLSPLIRISIILFGLVGGLYAGLFWWRKIYIERCLDKIFKRQSK